MRHFNLIDEPWIPVRFPDGTRAELGIQDTLLRAKEVTSIEDSSPLVVVSLHRFLLAVLYRALEGPTDIGQARKLFKEGLPKERIISYLEKWRDRFWLFNEKYPFGQNPNIPKDKIEPWTKLTAEYNATSNKVLFDHTDTKDPGEKKPKECATWLLSTMTFSISGGRGYYPSPSPNAMICIPLGRELQETLCYNLVPYPNREIMLNDLALWEREPEKLPLEEPKRISLGYADLYTWQPRMIFLERQPHGSVKIMRFVAGQGFENPSNSPDPMQPYRTDKTKGKLPVQFRNGRDTWRDFDSLLPDNTDLAPSTTQNAIRLVQSKRESFPTSVLILGLRYEPPSANVEFWRMERFILPEALASERSVRSEIHQLLTDAEDTQKALWAACSSFAQNLLGRGERPPDKKDVRKLVDQMAVSPLYWSILEAKFHTILRDFTLEREEEDIRLQWLGFIRDAFQTAWDQHRTSVSTGDAWAIRALVKAEKPIILKLKELNDEIQKLTPQQEEVI